MFNPGDKVRAVGDMPGYWTKGDEFFVDSYDPNKFSEEGGRVCFTTSPHSGWHANRFEKIESVLEVGKTYQTIGGANVTIVAEFGEGKFAGIYAMQANGQQLLRAYNANGRQYQYDDGSGSLKTASYPGNISFYTRRTRFLSLGTDLAGYFKVNPRSNMCPVIKVDYVNGKVTNATVVFGGGDQRDWSEGKND